MTTLDEQITHLLMDAAEAAGYSCRRRAEGFVGVIAPAKVCKLLEQIHARLAPVFSYYGEHSCSLHHKCYKQATLKITIPPNGDA